MPAGLVELAAATGASVLPIFTSVSGSKTHVRIGAPLPVSGAGAAAAQAAQLAAVRWLELRIIEHPDAWTGWRNSQYRADH